MTNDDIQRGIDAHPTVKEILTRHAKENPGNLVPMLSMALNSQIIPWYNAQNTGDIKPVRNTIETCERLAKQFFEESE